MSYNNLDKNCKLFKDHQIKTINTNNLIMVIGNNIITLPPVYNTPYPYPYSYPPNQMIYSNPNVQNTPQANQQNNRQISSKSLENMRSRGLISEESYLKTKRTWLLTKIQSQSSK